MKKTIIFILYASTITQIINCVTYLQALKVGLKSKVYQMPEVAHYMGNATMGKYDSEPIVLNTVNDVKKAYEQGLRRADLISYYQNQFWRSQLRDSARAQGWTIEEITPLLNQLNERISDLVDKYAPNIEEFEKMYKYDFGTVEEAVKYGDTDPKTWGLKESPQKTSGASADEVKKAVIPKSSHGYIAEGVNSAGIQKANHSK